ncbi:hypothetical protein LX95_01244 [Mesonia algae]|uniref:Type VI secretion system (T6SS) VasB/ImpH family protein n=1 Tax=Mesonia algae TaxID=213248 RepID=A0A2W7ISC4_9FLAO|nr:hypothetical protein [Mesonia algae]PZW41563.1 hypothetical protein LX95_01244 [Mesonia algae]
MVNKELENILNELKSVFEDIKAEVVVSEILENSNVDFSNLTINNTSTFKRPYRRDIIDYKQSLTNIDNYTLNFNLSRNGIYDSLPEGVFHNPSDPALKSLSYQKKREKQKQEEREARLFFQPIENETFNQYVNIEKEERALIDRFTDVKNNFLLKFWQADKSLPKKYLLKLIKLLPSIHKISGNLELTALCLERIIDEKVTLEKVNSPYKVPNNKEEKGESLGVDLVLGVDESIVLHPQINATIGPINKQNIKNFVDDSPTMRFIQVFYEYFIPMEMEVNTQIDFEHNNKGFVLHENEPALMGLTTTL